MFAKNKEDKDVVLLPDAYMMANYGIGFDFSDNYIWENKIDKVVFRGSSTGHKYPLKKKRITVCQWTLNNLNIYDFKITNIVQINPDVLYSKIPSFNNILEGYMSMQEQLKYKFMLKLYGNPSRWSFNIYKMTFT